MLKLYVLENAEVSENRQMLIYLKQLQIGFLSEKVLKPLTRVQLKQLIGTKQSNASSG